MKGGLTIMKEKHVFKKPEPKESLLGLDRQKRKLTVDEDAAGLHVRREYRQPRPETPSNVGGLAKEVAERRANRKVGARGLLVRAEDQRPETSHFDDKNYDKKKEWKMSPQRERGSTPHRNGGRTGSVRRTGGVGNWDSETPSVRQTGYDDTIDMPDGVDTDAWRAEQKQLDREWYSMEESTAVEDSHYEDYNGYYKKKEEEFKMKSTKKMTARQVQFNKDNDLWETNRMLTSGVVQRTGVDTDHDDENENRVHILVRNLKPPFLDGKIVYTTQIDVVQVLRDPTADMAICSRKGSRLVSNASL
jgi:pre-mRNA-splicing factor ATP-dependent RNA helicase DHX38/PRP16